MVKEVIKMKENVIRERIAELKEYNRNFPTSVLSPIFQNEINYLTAILDSKSQEEIEYLKSLL